MKIREVFLRRAMATEMVGEKSVPEPLKIACLMKIREVFLRRAMATEMVGEKSVPEPLKNSMFNKNT